MSQLSQPGWIWHPESRQYYYYDAQSDSLVFQDGRRVAKPSSIPRTSIPSADSRAKTSSYGPDATKTDQYYTLSSSGYQPQNSRGPAAVNSGNLHQPQSYPAQHPSATYAGAPAQRPQSQSGAKQRAHNPTPVASQVHESGGRRVIDSHDNTTQVRTVIQTAPVAEITDPALLSAGIQATRRILPSPGDEVTERLFTGFRRREQPRKFFVVGRVFLVLWVEPAGEDCTVLTNLEPGTSLGRYGERVYSKMRRFVVIRECDQYCSALPIASYARLGVGKAGIKKSDHAIIYTGRIPPDPLPTELPARGEAPMRPQSIRVIVDDPTDKLDNFSRLDYGRVHTITHNIKVKGFGMVHPASMNALHHQFANVWNSQPLSMQSSSSVRPKGTSTESRHLALQSSQAWNSGGSGNTGRQPSRASDLPTFDGDDGNNSRSSDQGREGVKTRALQEDVRRAVEKLIQRGYTREQAIQAIGREASRRKQAPKVSLVDSDDDDDDDEDEDDDDESDSDSDDEISRSHQSRGSQSGRAVPVRNQSRAGSAASSQGRNPAAFERRTSSSSATQRIPDRNSAPRLQPRAQRSTGSPQMASSVDRLPPKAPQAQAQPPGPDTTSKAPAQSFEAPTTQDDTWVGSLMTRFSDLRNS